MGIITVLRDAEVRIDQGKTVGKICRALGASEQAYYNGGESTVA